MGMGDGHAKSGGRTKEEEKMVSGRGFYCRNCQNQIEQPLETK